MLLRQFYDKESGTFSYLVATDYGGQALIIDPVLEQVNLYEKLINDFGLQLIYAIDTHTHADHVTGTGTLRQKLGCKVVMGKATQTKNVDLLLNEGEKLTVGNLTFTLLHTPGHTADSYCLLGEGCIFTGDTLFIRGTGRTDLASGDVSQAYDSLFNKLLKLPEATLVYPGHDYKVINVSTIGEEKKFNPRLQVQSVKEYAEIMGKLNLGKPNQYDRAMELNPTCGLAEGAQHV